MEEPHTVHMEVKRRKRARSLTPPESSLWCLLNMETSHADIANYAKGSVEDLVTLNGNRDAHLDEAEEDEETKGD
jgi:hypothetical protein